MPCFNTGCEWYDTDLIANCQLEPDVTNCEKAILPKPKNAAGNLSECSDLLERTAVLEAIGSISEYDNPILFRRELAISFLNKEINPDMVDDLVEMVTDLMSVAVKRTKQEITMKIYAL